MKTLEITSKLKADGEGGAWTFIFFPKRVTDFLGSKAMVPVSGTIAGMDFRTTLAPSGKGTHVMTVSKALQAAARVKAGDTVKMTLRVDDEERAITVPPDLRGALRASSKATTLWKAITPRAQEEWIEWITGAKKAATRERRVATAVEKLESGIRRAYQ